jgi:hypothetical protein
MADEMAFATPRRSSMAVFAVLVTIVTQRFAQDWAISVAELKPLPKVSARFWIGVPTALKRSEKIPLLSFAIAECLFKKMNIPGNVYYPIQEVFYKINILKKSDLFLLNNVH